MRCSSPATCVPRPDLDFGSLDLANPNCLLRPSSRPACRAVPQASRHKMTETASKIELFGKWTYDDVEINDISLEDYIAVG